MIVIDHKMEDLKKSWGSTISNVVPAFPAMSVPKFTQGVDRKIFTVALVGLLIYFMWMDIALYNKVLIRKPTDTHSSSVTKDGLLYFNPIEHYSVKNIMSFPLDTFVMVPLGYATERVFRFSKTFITPDVISVISLICGVIAGRFMLYDALWLRRIAAFFGFLRLFLDSLDGIVYRASHQSSINRSHLESFGGQVDMFCDTLGATAFLIGVFFHVARSKPRDCPHFLPLWRKNSSPGGSSSSYELVSSSASGSSSSGVTMGPPTSSSSSNNYGLSKKWIFLRFWWFAACLAIATTFWDRYNNQYASILEDPDPTVTLEQKKLQNDVYTATSTWILFWFWSMSNGIAVTCYLLVFICLDKTWEFIIISAYILTVYLPILCIVSEIHLAYARSYIGIVGDMVNYAEIGWIMAIPLITITGILSCHRWGDQICKDR